MKKIDVRSYAERLTAIQTRMNEITDLCEKENRQRSQAENTEFDSLVREAGVINARIQAANANGGFLTVSTQEEKLDEFLRSICKGTNKHVHSEALKRDYTGMMTADAAASIPLTIGDIVKPLEAGLIYDKVGLPLLTGLAGDYCWPVLGAVEASIADEGVELADSKIDIDELKPKPVRLGISIKVTNETINQTQGVVAQIIRQQMPLAMARLINKCMFVTSDQDTAYNAKFHGPFVEASSSITFAGAVPTYKELLQMKGKVLKTGVENDGTGAYVMNPEMAAILEATPRDAGSGLMIIEDGKIAGIPVFATSHIGDKIGFGFFGYEPLGQFGETNFIVDPYTEARFNSTVFTINADWSMTSLRKEAFCIGTLGA